MNTELAVLLECNNVSYGYYPRQLQIAGIDLQLATGEILALVGPNGAGKTTLLKNLSGLLKPSQGKIRLEGTDIGTFPPKELAQRLAAVEQEIQVGFDYSVYEIVELGRLAHHNFSGKVAKADETIIEKSLRKTDTWQLAHKSIHSLSSGEKQRVWLALALTQQPKILILDEPTSHLDIHYQIELLELIHNLAKQEGLAVVMSIHDLNLGAHYADQIAFMKNGRIWKIGAPSATITKELLEKIFRVKVEVTKERQSVYVRFSPQTLKN